MCNNAIKTETLLLKTLTIKGVSELEIYVWAWNTLESVEA